MKHAWIALLVAGAFSRPAHAEEPKTVDYGSDGGVDIKYKISDWCVMFGFKNTNSYSVGISFEFDTIGSKGDVHHFSLADVSFKPGQYRGGGHFFGDPAGLEDCPWVGEGQVPKTFKNFHMVVKNLDAEQAAAAQADAQRRQEEEQKRLEEEQRRKEEEQKRKDEEEKKRQEDERRKQEEAQKREQAEREAAVRRQQEADKEKRARDAKNARERNASVGGSLTPEQLREQKRQQDIAHGFQLLREAEDTNRQLGDSTGKVAGAVFAIQGGNEATATTTRAFRVLFDFGGRFVPVMQNTTGDTVVNESSEGTGGGFALDGGLEFWPRFVKNYGVGVGAEAGVAGMAMPGGGMYALRAGLGVKGYYGNDAKWSVLGELGLYGEKVGSSGLFIDAHVSGSASYHLWRLGLGPRYCSRPDASGHHCTTAWYGELLLDYPSLGVAPGPRSASAGSSKVVRLGVDMELFGHFGIAVELGIGYPAPGTANFQFDENADGRGTYFSLLLRKQWGWHGGHAAPPSPDASATAAAGAGAGAASLVFADKLIAFSSQYGEDSWSAKQALGAPNVYPRSGDDGNAWASQGTDVGPEFIEVGFSQPRRIRGVVVYETYNPGAISGLEIVSPSGIRTTIHVPSTPASGASRATPFDFECVEEPASSVRVNLDSAHVQGWNEIDAIAIVPC